MNGTHEALVASVEKRIGANYAFVPARDARALMDAVHAESDDRERVITSLRWALDYIRDGLTGVIPPHDCDFATNPEKGACDFHAAWVEACDCAGILDQLTEDASEVEDSADA